MHLQHISPSRPKSRVARLTGEERAHRAHTCKNTAAPSATRRWRRRGPRDQRWKRNVSARVQTTRKSPAYHCRCGSRLESYRHFPAQVSRRKHARVEGLLSVSKFFAFLRERRDRGGGGDGGDLHSRRRIFDVRSCPTRWFYRASPGFGSVFSGWFHFLGEIGEGAFLRSLSAAPDNIKHASLIYHGGLQKSVLEY